MHLDNLVEAVAKVLDAPNELKRPFIVADPEPLTVGEMIMAMRHALGRRGGLFPVPSPVLKAALQALGHAETYRLFAGSLVADSSALAESRLDPEHQHQGRARDAHAGRQRAERRMIPRRAFLQGAAALAMLSSVAGASRAGDATKAQPRMGQEGMAKDIVMLHGASAGGWCFDTFRDVFEGKGWAVHTPDLIGHGRDKEGADRKLVGMGLADYRTDFAAVLSTLPPQPVLLGHSMGALLAQQLAASGLARALILVSPAPRAGILPSSDSEKDLSQSLMGIPSFWKTVIDPDFDLACFYSLNRVPKDRQRAVFDKFGPESGLAYFEMFFWMIDERRAAAVETDAVRCPVLCLSGTDDNLVSLATARATALPYRDAQFWEEAGHGHMLPVEPGADEIARRIAAWIPA